MRDERTINILGEVKRKFSNYAMILAIIFFLLKLFLNKSIIVFDALPEIVLLISLIITSVKKPREDMEDERVSKNLNEHYNNAFKIILPVVLISYIISLIFILKTNAIVLLSPNLFINSFLFLVSIGVIFLVRKHKIYLNEKFLENKSYFTNIFKVIGYIFITSIGLSVITIFLNLIIPGSSGSNMLLFSMFLASFINLSVQYFLYSIYEYNHYNENIKLSEGKLFIITKNMLLYLGIVMFLGTLRYIFDIGAIILLNNQTLKTIYFLNLSQYLGYAFNIYNLLFLVIATYSMKESLLRLKNNSYNEIKKTIFLTNIYVIVSAIALIIFNLLFLMFKNNARLIMLLQTFNVWINMSLLVIYLIIIIFRFTYAKKRNFPLNKLLIIPIITTFLLIILGFGSGLLNELLNSVTKAILLSLVLEFILSIIVFINYVFIVLRYSKTFEVVYEENINL